jgi:hypothetical protein
MVRDEKLIGLGMAGRANQFFKLGKPTGTPDRFAIRAASPQEVF